MIVINKRNNAPLENIVKSQPDNFLSKFGKRRHRHYTGVLTLTLLALLYFGVNTCAAEAISQTFLNPKNKENIEQVTAQTEKEVNLGTWVRKADIPYAEDQLHGVVINDKLYSIGHLLPIGIERYDPEIDKWSKVADLPIEEYCRSGFGVGAIDSKIYFVGGYDTGPAPALEVYDLNTRKLLKLADMPTPRSHPGVGVIDGKLYVVGGQNRFLVKNSGDALPTLEMYDPKTNTWSKLADMPTRRAYMGIGVIEGKLYVAGGLRCDLIFRDLAEFAEHNFLSALEVYDPKINKWSKLSDMPTKKFSFGTGVIDKKLYFVGGFPDMSALEMYDPKTSKWLKLADMPTPRADLGACAIDNLLYAFGGNSPTPQKKLERSSILEVYDPNLKKNDLQDY